MNVSNGASRSDVQESPNRKAPRPGLDQGIVTGLIDALFGAAIEGHVTLEFLDREIARRRLTAIRLIAARARTARIKRKNPRLNPAILPL